MILLLGAGASQSFGIPVTKQFVSNLIAHLRSEFESSIIDSLLRPIQSTFSEEIDLEILLTILDDLSRPDVLTIISSVTTRFILSQNNPKEFIESKEIKERAGKFLELSLDYIRERVLTQTRERESDIAKVYDAFSSQLGQNFGNLGLRSAEWIFTSNYDQCLETYFNVRKIDFEDGIEKKHGINIFDVNRFMGPRARPRLVKIHGSVDLFRTIGGELVSIDLPFTKKREIIERGKTFPRGVKLEEEILLYPTEAGADRRVIESPFSEMYYYLRMAFTNDPTLIIVGFSMRDRAVISILRNVILSGKLPRNADIRLIDPNAGKIIEILKARKDPFANYMSPYQRTLEEFGSKGFH